MEAARLGLHDYQLGGLRPGLGLEPWLGAGPPLSTLSHALPGFLSHPQTPYASYLPVSGAAGGPTVNPLLPGLMTMSHVPCFPSPAPPPTTPPMQAWVHTLQQNDKIKAFLAENSKIFSCKYQTSTSKVLRNCERMVLEYGKT